MKKRSSAVVQKLCQETHSLIQNGLAISEACKTTTVNEQSYRRWVKLNKPKRAYTKARKLLNIQDLPSFNPPMGKPFLVFGSPNQLSEFAKGMS